MSLTPDQISAEMEKLPTLWIKKYGIKNEQNKKLDFKNHMYLWDIYNDFSPEQVIMKAAQIGFSTLAIIKTFFIAKNKKMDIIYSLPTAGDVNNFVSGKTNRMIQNNTVLQHYTADKDSIEQKQVGRSMIYYKGTYTERAALMTTADLYCADEVDRSKQDIVGQYESRLQHSDYRWRWYFSNPSVQGHGVSKYWDQSDQMHWIVTCSHCGKKQFMDFPDSFDLQKEIYVCKKCGKEIYADDIRKGEWVARFPERSFRGYWIPLWLYPKIDAKEIIRYHREKTEEYFANFVAGKPYIGDGNTIPWDYILRNITTEINDQDGVMMGCDSGNKKHYVLGNKKGIFYYGVTTDWNDIRVLMKRFPKMKLVVDAMPDLTGPRILQEEFYGRVFTCHYAQDRKTQELVRWGEKDDFGTVLVDRNRMIQTVVDEMKEMRLPFCGKPDDFVEYYSQLKSSYRVMENNALGVPVMKWDSDGNDHWLHATVYWRTAMSRFGNQNDASIISNEKNNQIAFQPYIEPDGTYKPNIILPKR